MEDCLDDLKDGIDLGGSDCKVEFIRPRDRRERGFGGGRGGDRGGGRDYATFVLIPIVFEIHFSKMDLKNVIFLTEN